MNIPEAIERLNRIKGISIVRDYPHDVKATALGIEALERERDCRANMPREEWLLLPSETEEQQND